MPGPLDGYRIVDLTTMISGPMATCLLGDQGADVIKVEAPGVGDLVRRLGVPRDGITATFATTNRNKRSIVLDLKHEADDRAAFEKLVATADVVVQNSEAGKDRDVTAWTASRLACVPSAAATTTRRGRRTAGAAGPPKCIA